MEKITNKDIAEYYGQIYDNIKHMTKYLEKLRDSYEKENYKITKTKKQEL